MAGQHLAVIQPDQAQNHWLYATLHLMSGFPIVPSGSIQRTEAALKATLMRGPSLAGGASWRGRAISLSFYS